MWLQPLSTIHFTDEFHRGDDGDNFRKAHLPTLYALMGLALFILIIAAVNFINPLMWALTLSYFALRPVLGSDVQRLYPPYIFYFAITTLLIGNMLFLYMFLLGAAKRGHFDLVKFALLAPLYWLMMSVAACYALAQLVHRPHYWEKTDHGLHLKAAAL